MSNYGSSDPNQQGDGQYGQQGSGQPYGGSQGYGQMPGGGGPVGTPPNNNLVIAILSTVLCCLPLGIYAIIQATKVNGLWQQGDTAGAQKAADDAKKFSIIGAVVGLVISVIYMILMFTVLNNSNA
ncbi:CD225/dispanin family protein [Yimella sp. cx-51]|uniref:CD225/dispanin family protein n=1 Tax=Yimella sp. cx-51 TaxID=2770551 RepID=UPI00165D73DA|nr:CD225/dispanin family protein [Yimella sp. cx-51]MBC9955794.1 CD225/dispanin family protein [Yimella sp. cx-51]